MNNRRMAGNKNANTRLAIYHIDIKRTYKRTIEEIKNETVYCPRCKKQNKLIKMGLHPYTKSTKIYICPKCDWKITTDKIV